MKVVDNKKKDKSLLKKIFIKLCRKIGYEIIDQNNLFIPTLEKYSNENLSKPGSSSINVPLGKTNISRKVEDLTIFIRSYTSLEVEKSKIMLDQNKSRIFDLPKIEYTLRTINSIIISCSEKNLSCRQSGNRQVMRWIEEGSPYRLLNVELSQEFLLYR